MLTLRLTFLFLADRSTGRIHAIIDKATPETIGSAGVVGSSVPFDRKSLSSAKRAEVDRFLYLFDSQTRQQRLVILWKMFYPSLRGDFDLARLRAWLKEIAEIMRWQNEGQVKALLGISVPDLEAEARQRESHAEANALLDELDMVMVRPPTG